MGCPQGANEPKGKTRAAPPLATHGMIMAQPWPHILQSMDPDSVCNARLIAVKKADSKQIYSQAVTGRQRLWLAQTGI